MRRGERMTSCRASWQCAAKDEMLEWEEGRRGPGGVVVVVLRGKVNAVGVRVGGVGVKKGCE